jgi:hypothetical protein
MRLAAEEGFVNAVTKGGRGISELDGPAAPMGGMRAGSDHGVRTRREHEKMSLEKSVMGKDKRSFNAPLISHSSSRPMLC